MGGQVVHLVKPLTFMNASGLVLPWVLRQARASMRDVVVVCDSLDLPAGVCRLKARGSSGGHRGLESIIRQAGTTDFARLVIGIGRPQSREDVVSYVLGRPGSAEAAAFEAALDLAAEALARLPLEGLERVANEVNRVAGQG